MNIWRCRVRDKDGRVFSYLLRGPQATEAERRECIAVGFPNVVYIESSDVDPAEPQRPLSCIPAEHYQHGVFPKLREINRPHPRSLTYGTSLTHP